MPHALITECGFVDRADTQAAFASRAALLYDFQVDSDDALACLQGSLLMTKVLLEHPADKDYNYWFYNALRLATKLGLYSQYVSVLSSYLSGRSTYRRVEKFEPRRQA